MNTALPSSKFDSQKENAIILFVIGALLFFYACLRAYILSFTWDESYTYLFFVKTNFWIPSQWDWMSANNHFLNTWMMKLSYMFWGSSELSLRLPNLLAYPIYLYYSAKLSSTFASRTLVVGSFLVFNLHHYMLDFFSLARGYGISLGFVMASIYFLYVFVFEGKKSKHAACSIFWASLGVLANLTVLYYLTALIMAIIAIRMIDAKTKSFISIRGIFKNTNKILFAPMLLLFFLSPVVYKLIKSGAFFCGGKNLFSTLDSIKWIFSCNRTYQPWLILEVKLFVGVSVAFFVFFLVLRAKNKNFIPQDYFLAVMASIVLICFLINIILHTIFGIWYVKGRTVLFIVPLIITGMILMFQNILPQKKWRTAPLLLLATLVSFHFISCMNLKYSIQWKENADIKQIMTYFNAEHEKTKFKGKKISLEVDFDLELPVRFYRDTKEFYWLNVVKNDRISDPQADFYLFTESPMELKDKLNLHLIKRSPLTHNMIFMNR